MQIMDVFLSMFLDGFSPIVRLDNIVGKSNCDGLCHPQWRVSGSIPIVC